LVVAGLSLTNRRKVIRQQRQVLKQRQHRGGVIIARDAAHQVHQSRSGAQAARLLSVLGDAAPRLASRLIEQLDGPSHRPASAALHRCCDGSEAVGRR
jgi:hypothetical protein